MKIHVAYSAFERERCERGNRELQAKFQQGKCLEHERACSLLSGRVDPQNDLSWASLPEKFCLYIFTIGKIVQSLCKVLGMGREVGGNRERLEDEILGGETLKDSGSQDIWKSHLQCMEAIQAFDRGGVAMRESGAWSTEISQVGRWLLMLAVGRGA